MTTQTDQEGQHAAAAYRPRTRDFSGHEGDETLGEVADLVVRLPLRSKSPWIEYLIGSAPAHQLTIVAVET